MCASRAFVPCTKPEVNEQPPVLNFVSITKYLASTLNRSVHWFVFDVADHFFGKDSDIGEFIQLRVVCLLGLAHLRGPYWYGWYRTNGRENMHCRNKHNES